MNTTSRSRLLTTAKCTLTLAAFIIAGYMLSTASTAETAGRKGRVAQNRPTGTPGARRVPNASLPSLPTYTGDRTSCDVLIIGGTPAGIAAGLSAARRGADVIMVEPRSLLGGDVVYAMLNQFDVPARPGEASPVHGIFAEFYDQLGISFSISKARHLFEDTVAVEPTLHAYIRTNAVRVIKENDRVVGAVLKGASVGGRRAVEQEVRAKVVIDATNDASFAARAGAGYYVGRENANPDKAMQSAGLLFSLRGVDWNALKRYVKGRRLMKGRPKKPEATSEAGLSREEEEEETAFKRQPKKPVWLRLGGVHGGYIWERGDMIRGYKPRGKNIEFLSINFGIQGDSTVVLNTLNIIGVNGLDQASKNKARQEAIAELPYFIVYLRKLMPAFRNAALDKIAPELYIRETRHIHGFYSLKVADVRAETRFADRIAMVSYPLDLHPYTKGQVNPFGPRRYYYTLPLRCLVPRKVDGLFVASRSLSATYSAAGSARVIPINMAAGEAAGTAAWVCVRKGIEPHDLMQSPLAIHEVQNSLREWGADIGDTYPDHPKPNDKKKKPAPKDTKTVRSMGT